MQMVTKKKLRWLYLNQTKQTVSKNWCWKQSHCIMIKGLIQQDTTIINTDIHKLF